MVQNAAVRRKIDVKIKSERQKKLVIVFFFLPVFSRRGWLGEYIL